MSGTGPGPARAILAPATARSLRRRWSVVAAVAVLAAATLAAGAAAFAASRADRSVGPRGVATGATVVEVVTRTVVGDRTPDGSIRVRFPLAGEPAPADPVEALVDAGRAVSAYRVGDVVRIVYDPDDPGRAELEGVAVPDRGLPAAVPLALGAALAVMALVGGRRAWRIRRVVRREPWWPADSRLVELPLSSGLRAGSRTLVRLDVPSGPVLVEPAGLGRLAPTFSPEAWVAGLDGPTTVLAAPGGGHVLAVRRRRPNTGRDTGRGNGGGRGGGRGRRGRRGGGGGELSPAPDRG